MDLRRSIEKAKKMRREAQQANSRGSFRVVKKEEPREGSAGWVSPVYKGCRKVTLHRKTLERNRCVCVSPKTPEMAYYKVLRTQVKLHCEKNGWNTVMITSVQPGEGKTLTAINLALALAQEFSHTVLLVDCDLRRQDIHRDLGYPSRGGLVHHLLERKPLEEVIVWPGIEKLTVISGGRSVHNSTELLTSPRMKASVTEMKTRYSDRYVLFDLPPVLSSDDAMAFASLVDCILLVVQAEKTPIQDIRRAYEMIPQDKFLGFVLNRQKSTPNGYYHEYYKKRH